MSVGLHSVGTYAVGLDPVASTSTNTNIAPANGALTVTGYAPTLTQTANRSLALTAGSLSITGYAPTIVQTAGGPISLTVGTGSLAITGYAPTVTQSSVGTTPAPADGGGAGNLKEVRRFAELLSKPTKEAKKKRRQVIEAVALQLLPDEPVAKRVAQHIAEVIVRKEVTAISRWMPERAMMPIATPQPSFDAHEAVMRMVADWLANEQARRELEDEEDEMLLLG